MLLSTGASSALPCMAAPTPRAPPRRVRSQGLALLSPPTAAERLRSHVAGQAGLLSVSEALWAGRFYAGSAYETRSERSPERRARRWKRSSTADYGDFGQSPQGRS